MRQHLKPTILAFAAFAICGLTPVLAGAQERPEDHHVMRADEHHDERGGADPAAQYRHDHPHSSARCHDGFFTSTRDRNHACTKHGGIDIWLSL
jgi:hypothetical protein